MFALSVLVVIYYLDEVYPPFYSLLSSAKIYMHACYLIKLYSVLMNTPIIADFEPCVDWPDGDRQDRGQSVICEDPFNEFF